MDFKGPFTPMSDLEVTPGTSLLQDKIFLHVIGFFGTFGISGSGWHPQREILDPPLSDSDSDSVYRLRMCSVLTLDYFRSSMDEKKNVISSSLPLSHSVNEGLRCQTLYCYRT